MIYYPEKWDDLTKKYGWLIWLALTVYKQGVEAFLGYSRNKLGYSLPVTRVKELFGEIESLRERSFYMAFTEGKRESQDLGL